MRSRKYPGHTGTSLRERLARRLKGGKAQRLRAKTQAEALVASYCDKLVAELHNPNSRARSETFAHRGRLLDLEASYVPLQVSVTGDGEPHPYLGEGEIARRDNECSLPKAMPPEDALLQFRHLAVLGDPGAGKTTMLRYLTLLAAQGKLENLPDFPIFIPLSHFATTTHVHLVDFAISEVEAYYGFPELRPELVEGLRPYLEERLEEGAVLFLLDGLNEATHRHVVGQINVLAARYPNCPMVVTATTNFRPGSWKGLLAARFHTVEVLGFNNDDIQRFIINWFGAGSDQARALQDALSKNPRMWTLAANPLLLSLMAFTFEQDGELPEGRAGLYRRSVELLLKPCPELALSRARPESHRKVEGHSRRNRDLKRASSLTVEYKRSLLEEVALHFHLQRALLLPEGELSEIIASCLSTVAVLEEISGRDGLLREQVVGWVGFPHPTWQEYLAAAAISRRGQLELVWEGLHDPWWEGTALFLAEVLEDAAPFLEGILAQEEDIFYSNLLLAGRCLAGISPIESSVGDLLRPSEDIIKGLKRLVEGGHHRLLQRQAIRVLAKMGGGAVAAFFVTLLRRKKIDPNVRAEVAEILGSLHEKLVIPDLLAFLTDEKLAPSLRGNIAEALGSLGDESVVPPLLALLPDETVDPSVRGRVVEALVFLNGESVFSSLLTLLPDEGIDPYVRQRISGAVLSSPLPFVLHPPVLSQLLSLLPDEKIHPSVRWSVAEAVGSLGDKSAVPDLLALLSDEKIDPSVRGKAAEAFGVLGAESAIPPLLAILGDERVNYNVRITVAEVLGVLGDESVASRLLALLSDGKIDPDVRASIAGALGVLDDRSVIPQLLALLPDEKVDPAVRWRIVDALSSLGEKKIIPYLRALLPNEDIDPSVRWVVAEAIEALAREPTENGEWRAEDGDWRMEKWSAEEDLGSLDDRSRVPQFLALLKDKKLDPSVSGRIIEALGSLGDDRATVEGLAALLDREDIGSRVYEALFYVSQRARVRVFARKGGGYEVRPLGTGRYQDRPIGVETLQP